MNHPSASGNFDLLARATGIVGLLAGIYALAAKLFSLVTRKELAKIIAAQDRKFLEAQNRMQSEVERKFIEHRRERAEMHSENKDLFRDVFTRTAGVEQGQARIEGKIEGLLEQLRRDT